MHPPSPIEPVQPTDPLQRVDLIDALRGFALAGVLLANLVAFSLYAFLPGPATAALPTAGIDRWLAPTLDALVSGRFITLFSLLFGVGFALQMQRAGSDPEARRRYLRRLGALLVIGLLHGALWWGDVLRYYAVIGLVLLPAYRWPTRQLLVLGMILIVVPQPLLAHLFSGMGPPMAIREVAFADVFSMFSGDGWVAMLRGNAAFMGWWLSSQWGVPLSIAGCMLIGAALGRSGALRDSIAGRSLWRWLLLALPLGLAMSLVVVLSGYGYLPWPSGWQADGTAGMLLRMLNRAAGLVMALGYMAGFVQLFGARLWRPLLQPLAPVGRMALSNYLAQTAVAIGLFYGVGLGVGATYGLVGVIAAWMVIFAGQLAVSHWWLARFRFGPAEWAWRSATYGRWQAMRY